MIKLLPTCTLPNATFDTEIDIWALAATEMMNSETKIGIQQAGLRGALRHLIIRSLFCTRLLGTAGDLSSVASLGGQAYDHVTDTSTFCIVSGEENFR